LFITNILGSISPPVYATTGPAGTYVEIFWKRDENYNFDVDLEITDAPETSTHVLFWAHQFGFVNGNGGYIGLQVVGSQKKAVFSIWGAITGEPGNMIEEDGKVWSIVVDYNWKLGQKYRLRIWELKVESNGDEWWLGAVYDYASGTDTTIGKILVPAAWGWLTSYSITWIEYAGYNDHNPSDIPYTRAVFSNHYARNAIENGSPDKMRVSYGTLPSSNSDVDYYGDTRYALEAGDDVVRDTPEGWLSEPEPEFTILIDEAHDNWGTSGSPPAGFGSPRGSWMNFSNELKVKGYEVLKLTTGKITSSILQNCDILIIGTAWGEFTVDEIQAIEDFVSSGGGLFLTGAGWSWVQYHPGSTINDYPMNVLASRFGVTFNDDIMHDPQNNNGDPTSPIFNVTSDLLTTESFQVSATGCYPCSLNASVATETSIRGSESSYTRFYEQGSCPPLLFAVRHGYGKVVCLGHEGFFFDLNLYEYGNLKLGLNIINWLVTSEGYPDLVISDISWEPNNPIAGDSVTFSCTIKNQGNKDTGAFTAALYIDGERIDISARTSLAAGESATRQFTYGWPATEGSHTIEVVADDLNEIVESNETNNKISEKLTVSPVKITAEIAPGSEPDNRITPGDRVYYYIYVENHGQVSIENVKVTVTSPLGTPIGLKTGSLKFESSFTQNYGTVSPNGKKGDLLIWEIQVWKTKEKPYYPGEDLPATDILLSVPIGNFELNITIEWRSPSGTYMKTEALPIKVQYPYFDVQTVHEKYTMGSSYYHPDDERLKKVAAKAVCGISGIAEDKSDVVIGKVYSWVMHYFKQSLIKPLSRWDDLDIISRIQQGKDCGVCVQCADLTVSLLRSLGIPARITTGNLYFGPIPVGHTWVESYMVDKWIHVDPSMGFYDEEEPFESYVNLWWCASIKAATCIVTDCPEYTPLKRPWDCSCYKNHWEDVSSEYSTSSNQKTSGTAIMLEESEHYLFLHVYDSQGRHVGVNYATNQTEFGIPGSYYAFDVNSTLVFLPANITDFYCEVDAKYAEQLTETYNLTLSMMRNSEVISQKNIQSSVQKDKKQEYAVQISPDEKVVVISSVPWWQQYWYAIVGVSAAVVFFVYCLYVKRRKMP